MKIALLLSIATLVTPLHALQTIDEKKGSLEKGEKALDIFDGSNDLHLVNQALREKRSELETLAEQARLLHEQGDAQGVQTLAAKLRLLREEINEINEMWRSEIRGQSTEEYALWHAPETTLRELVTDYGALDHIYIIPAEIGSIALSINSTLAIPKESWAACLELILERSGVGVRQLNPYLRELYLLRQDISCISCITANVTDLEHLRPETHVCFVLSPDGDPHSIHAFLQKFSSSATTTLEIIRGDIFIIASVDAVKELLKLYDFVKSGDRCQDYQVASLSKINSKEMQTILESAFPMHGEEGLAVIALSSGAESLFLSGTKEEVLKAKKLIQDVESSIEDAKAKTVFWYTAKHSDAEDLALVLAKVYDLLVANPTAVGKSVKKEKMAPENGEGAHPKETVALPVAPANITPLSSERTSHRTLDGQNNFIVDKKTGSIIMVVEQEALSKIKALLKKLDVPKKMVQLEVLLFEKKISNQNKSGLNLLRLGSQAVSTGAAALSPGLSWNSKGSGILEFLISHSKGSSIPAFDLAYHFLLGQEDVQINCSPSVTTVNQTPATIAVVEEISINTGVDSDGKKERNSYERAQYGITIQITPTINSGEEEKSLDETSYITLDTDITFDTTQKSASDRPDVTRRHIKNHVRIADGQTVILGGLRRKSTEDSKESIPFLGEIPGIGKLFSTTDLYDSSTEMFVFITPKIITDPTQDATKQQKEAFQRRPGDIPPFLQELATAQSKERKKLFEQSLTALFGRVESASSRRIAPEYDGR